MQPTTRSALWCCAATTLLALVSAQSDITCKDGAHIIVARESNAAPGYGLLVDVKDMILAQINNSDAVAVPYPATIFPPAVLYIDSEPQGVGNFTELVKEYGDACPDGKMVVMGYSQGAQVIGDSLIGSNYIKFDAFKNTTGLDQKYLDQIVAIIMMGDPANVSGQPFLVGNSTLPGSFPRNNTANWESTGLVSKIQSFCDHGDTFCASGKDNNSLNIHVGYIPEYGQYAAQFVVNKFMEANGTNLSAIPGISAAGRTVAGSGGVWGVATTVLGTALAIGLLL